MPRLLFLLLLLLLIPVTPRSTQTQERVLRVAVLDFGLSSTGKLASARLAESIKQSSLKVLDLDLSRAAAKGAGFENSLNLTRQQARELGEVLGSDFYLIGDARTLRRSPSDKPVYFEAYASIFLVSSRTGRLILWERPSFAEVAPERAELLLLKELASASLRDRFSDAIKRAHSTELTELVKFEGDVPLIEIAPDDDQAASAQGLRLPRPFRRLRPAYPETAAKAEVEATVDVYVDIDIKGDVTNVEIARWAGFGLDQATVETVRKLQFFPAMRNGRPIPIRVLLRYNFRKPPIE